MEIKRVVSQYLDSNVFVLAKNNQVVIVDAGVETEKIAKVVADKKVLGVLLTHGHYDHSLFAGEYAEKFDCKVYCSNEALHTLADGEENYSEGQFIVTDFSRFVVCEDSEKIILGEFEIEFLQTKGHSRCSASFLIEKQLFSGDTLFAQGIGRTDLVGSNKYEMLSSLERLEKVDFEYAYSGHGESSTKEEQQKNIAIFKRFLKR